MITIFIFYPVLAIEKNETTAWDAGYVRAPVILSTTTAVYNAPSGYGGSCVQFVKNSIGETDSWWSPYHVWHNLADFSYLQPLPYPIQGSILITNEGPVWHMGIVIEVDSFHDIIKIRESNFSTANTISERTLNITDQQIVGFLKYK